PAPDSRPRTDRRGPPPRRSVRGALSGDRRPLDRAEEAPQACPGARPRPAATRAQAPAPPPGLLLPDEPTNGLDPAGRDEMLELVRRTGTEFGIAVIVASHLLGGMERVCDNMAAIEG